MDVIIPKRQQAKSITLSSRFDGIIGKPVLPDTLVFSPISYTPDEERFSSVLKYLNNIKRTVYYSDGYEEVSDDSLGNYSITYLGEDIIGVKRNNAVTYYYLLTDHQGSVLGIYDASGTEKYSATYDAWGRQTVKKNDIGFLRGYTGHEMMPEFKLINMNGRLYDPLLGRFLSPDNYVQLPDFSQSLNRYSYCLNNPLKYTDPSGELFGLDDALVFSIVSGAMMGAFNAKVNGENAWKGAFLGAASGAASYGIGSAFGHSIGTFGHELLRAGAHGVAQGALSYANGGNFGTGFATGFASSLAGSGAQALSFSNTGIIATTTVAGATTSATFGGSWLDGAMIGLDIGYYNHGWTTKYGDLTYELDEVTVYGHRPRLFRNFPVEKPLRAVYPEFGLLLGIKVVANFVRGVATSYMPSQGFSSYTQFKQVYGNAGKGQAWHHIVEQTPSNVSKFGPERIHNIDNMVKLPHGKGTIHNKISGYYSSKMPFTNGMRVRDWLSSQSYEEQYQFGIDKLREYGWKF